VKNKHKWIIFILLTVILFFLVDLIDPLKLGKINWSLATKEAAICFAVVLIISIFFSGLITLLIAEIAKTKKK